MASPVEIVQKLLGNMTNNEVVEALVASDAAYISLSHSNPDLKKIMPWCGSYPSAGPSAFISTFSRVARFWTNEGVELQTIFGSGEDVAAFGIMTLRSNTLGIAKTTPFAVWCRVKEVEGSLKIVFMQFMEDTFDTASTFRSGGSWKFKCDPDTKEELSI